MSVANLSARAQTYLAEFESVEREARELVGALNDDQFNWRPAADRWSVGECLEHLNVAGYLLLPKLRDAIEEGRLAGRVASGSMRYRMLERAFIRMMSPESRMRFKTPPMYSPQVRTKIDLTVPRFLDLQRSFRLEVERSDGLDLRQIRVVSPVTRYLTMGIGAWFDATIAHERRHLAQARGVMTTDGFPASVI